MNDRVKKNSKEKNSSQKDGSDRFGGCEVDSVQKVDAGGEIFLLLRVSARGFLDGRKEISLGDGGGEGGNKVCLPTQRVLEETK